MSFKMALQFIALFLAVSALTCVSGDYRPTVVHPVDFNIVTVTSTVTRTHNIWKKSTTDVLVTSAVLVPLTVTQYQTKRDYIRDDPNTVTSFIRVTSQPVVIETRTIEKFPVRTVVSRYTDLRTVTSTVEFWQPITHYSTSFEVVRLPVEETSTLYEVAYETVTTVSTIFVTVTHKNFGYGQKIIF
ncbi:hypothetical protein Anas_05707 [Armadillidium nasatum]|uniref:Uncharacterized protein n=1 Tax=Armadillidium nasatum TaxID=96803 RepID=A0A5N5TG82_9CRUS|nr:hypothetical protein Anas_05707 [Armadillidium nasatum]